MFFLLAQVVGVGKWVRRGRWTALLLWAHVVELGFHLVHQQQRSGLVRRASTPGAAYCAASPPPARPPPPPSHPPPAPLQDVCGTCERILRAPIPLSYTRHTSRFMTIYLSLLPVRPAHNLRVDGSFDLISVTCPCWL